MSFEARARGDDRLFAYAVHMTDDALVILDTDDGMNGKHLLTARFKRAGDYKLHITLRQEHIMGSPFDLIVHTLPPWAPTSEYFPLAPDGLRADVRMELQEWTVPRMSGWGVPHIGYASRAEPVVLGEDADAAHMTYRIPAARVVPHPDLQAALEAIELNNFNGSLGPTGKQRQQPAYAPVVLHPDGSIRKDVKPVFMYFGKQFHCTYVTKLGEPLRMGVILRDKCGNEIKDYSWYSHVRADVHRLIGTTSYGVHVSTIRMKYNDTVHAFGSIDAVMEAARTDKTGKFLPLDHLKSVVPSATTIYDAHFASTQSGINTGRLSHATGGSGRDMKLLASVQESMVLGDSFAASTAPDSIALQGFDTAVSVDGMFSTLSFQDIDRSSTAIDSGVVPLLDSTAKVELRDGDDRLESETDEAAAPAIVLANPLHDEFGMTSDVLPWEGKLDAADAPVVAPPDVVGLEASTQELDAMPTESLRSASEVFSASQSVTDAHAPPLNGWSLDLDAIPAMFEEYVVVGTFGEVGEHSVSFTVTDEPIPDPWDGSLLYDEKHFIRKDTLASSLSVESALSLDLSQHVTTVASEAQLSRRTSRLGTGSKAGTASMTGRSKSSSKGSLKLGSASASRRSSKASKRSQLQTIVLGDGEPKEDTEDMSKYYKVPLHVLEYQNKVRSAHKDIKRDFHRKLKSITDSTVISSQPSSLMRRSSSFSGIDKESSLDPQSLAYPLTYNSLFKKAELYQPAPDDYIGLPALYKVSSGPAVAARTVIHYLDPLLLELPRLTTQLAAPDAAYHRDNIVKDAHEKQSSRSVAVAPLPEPLTVPLRVPVGMCTVVGITLADEWGNPSHWEAYLDAVLRGPGGDLVCTVNSVDVDDKLLRAPIAQMVSRHTLSAAHNAGRHETRKLDREANVDTAQWYAAFYSFTTGVHKLHVTQKNEECANSPLIVEV